MKNKYLKDHYALDNHEIELIENKYKEIVTLYLSFYHINKFNIKRYYNIRESEIIKTLICLYKIGEFDVLNYLPLFICHYNGYRLDEILSILYYSLKQYNDQEYIYSRFGNLLIMTIDNQNKIFNYLKDNEKDLIKRFIEVCNKLYSSKDIKCFSLELYNVDTFIDYFFTYVIFRNKTNKIKEINYLLSEIEKDYRLFASKIELNNIFNNLFLYFDNYLNSIEKNKIYIK